MSGRRGLSVSDGKMKKERAIVCKGRDRMQQELEKLRDGLSKKGYLKAYPKVLERIDRIRQRYSRVSKGFAMTVKEHQGKAKDGA